MHSWQREVWWILNRIPSKTAGVGDANFRAISNADEQVAVTATAFRQAGAGEPQDFPARDSGRDGDAERRAVCTGHGFGATLGGALGADPQIAAQIGPARFKTKTRPHAQPHLHKTALKRLATRQAETRARRGVRRNIELVNFRSVRVRRVFHAHFQRGAAEELLDAKMRVLLDVTFDFSTPHRRDRRLGGGAFTIIGTPFGGIVEDFVRGIQLLGPRDSIWRIGVQIGVISLGEEPVGSTNLRERAAAVEAERGVVIGGGGRQVEKLTHAARGANPNAAAAYLRAWSSAMA